MKFAVTVAQRARDLIDTPQGLERLQQRGFELMQARPIGKYLRVALAQA